MQLDAVGRNTCLAVDRIEVADACNRRRSGERDRLQARLAVARRREVALSLASLRRLLILAAVSEQPSPAASCP